MHLLEDTLHESCYIMLHEKNVYGYVYVHLYIQLLIAFLCDWAQHEVDMCVFPSLEV